MAYVSTPQGDLALFLLPTKKPPLGVIRKWRFLLLFLVGATGFEPATSATPLQRATKLRHAPHRVLETMLIRTMLIRTMLVGKLCPKNEAYPTLSRRK